MCKISKARALVKKLAGETSCYFSLNFKWRVLKTLGRLWVPFDLLGFQQRVLFRSIGEHFSAATGNLYEGWSLPLLCLEVTVHLSFSFRNGSVVLLLVLIWTSGENSAETNCSVFTFGKEQYVIWLKPVVFLTWIGSTGYFLTWVLATIDWALLNQAW